jgi:hypothetical protein
MRTCKPNSVLRLAAQRRSFLLAAHHWTAPATYPEVAGPGSFRCWGLLYASSRYVSRQAGTPSLFGLAPCGVYPALAITGEAVRSYRTFSPLPRDLTPEAVCSLWHWPYPELELRTPDVIRHTALRSSDFPLPRHTSLGDLDRRPRRYAGQRSPGPHTYIYIDYTAIYPDPRGL